MARHEILSPLPGTFYRKPSPDAQPYVKEGDSVKPGDTIGLVEVMKQFSEVHADAAGKVVRFLVENEGTVEPGQTLLIIETA
ncbi:MAG: biotin carboxyl carrier domain-containing protein [Proteobacteria bacterium]|nr:MAG: biotin carboxyl carrier domain-containing protein [Pseudomonadota bacterium]